MKSKIERIEHRSGQQLFISKKREKQVNILFEIDLSWVNHFFGTDRTSSNNKAIVFCVLFFLFVYLTKYRPESGLHRSVQLILLTNGKHISKSKDLA